MVKGYIAFLYRIFFDRFFCGLSHRLDGLRYPAYWAKAKRVGRTRTSLCGLFTNYSCVLNATIYVSYSHCKVHIPDPRSMVRLHASPRGMNGRGFQCRVTPDMIKKLVIRVIVVRKFFISFFLLLFLFLIEAIAGDSGLQCGILMCH